MRETLLKDEVEISLVIEHLAGVALQLQMDGAGGAACGAAKGLAHWLTTAVPLIVAAPLIGLLLDIEAPAQSALALTLLVGTPALTFIGIIGAAIAVSLRRGGLLLAIIVLPLTVPVLIFSVAAANAAVTGPVPFGTPFTVLCALTLASLVVGPFAAAAALRLDIE